MLSLNDFVSTMFSGTDDHIKVWINNSTVEFSSESGQRGNFKDVAASFEISGVTVNVSNGCFILWVENGVIVKMTPSHPVRIIR